MKFIMFIMFSIGLLNFCYMNLYMCCLLVMFFMLININLIFNLFNLVNMTFSIDFYSMYLIILSIFIISLMLMISMEKFSMFLILLLLLLLILSFSTMNFLMFYFMFEASLIPIFLLIVYNGYSFERYEAAMYMFFFTMISSLPFLMIIIYIMENFGTLMYLMLEILQIKLSSFIFLVMLMVFLVKMPMFFFHIWLPKAHVEAPVYGSMILAGVLLKLGSYGILRLAQFFPYSLMKLSSFIISVSLVGGVVMSLVCLVQVDMKMLVAYSSVVHMSMLIASLMTLSKIGFIGSYLMMIGHGLCSSGLFYIVNINYEYSGSRFLYLNKGTINLNSSLTMWWFLLCISNFSAPISLSLIGEILMLMSLVSLDYLNLFYLMMLCFISAAYSLYLFSYTQHGQMNQLYMKFFYVNVKEYMILFLHWFYLNMMTFCLNYFMI
uniref:NADH-ubiquinone oxidoreductase chain 4 n=1 Tax=Allorhynchium sp. YN TaxID=2742724 RepID=A0A6M9AWY6_9HYME|nr:NADH dehydrogenase subunit 4 [Allorhynchium sp. YN]QKK69215.1 NADH dehydrogenase subunit 4 [Allorhynchium sp. YN]